MMARLLTALLHWRRYALLKSNPLDEASMPDLLPDLSGLVFKIIPYDKSDVIQMM
jgi:NIMA (never in mitosis gene a)-related kinase